MSERPVYPIRTIRLPWSVRRTFNWTKVNVYEPGPSWQGRDPRYSVRIGVKERPEDVEQLPGYMEAWSELHHRTPSDHPYPLTVSSAVPPWVRHCRGVGQLQHELAVLDASNVGRDQVFDSRDLLLHVQGYDAYTSRYWEQRGNTPRHFSLLGLVGVEIVEDQDGTVWPLYPVPGYRMGHNDA